MHLRPARARAAPVRAGRTVRRMSQRSLFAEPLIAGLDYRDGIHHRRRGSRADCTTRARSTSPRSASTAGSATARRRASAGATISTTPASRRPSRCPTGCCRCATQAAAFAGVAARRFRPRRWSPATIPAPASAGTATARCSTRSSACRSARPRRCASASRTPAGFRRASLEVEPRSAYLLSGEARHEWEHSIAPGDALRFSITFRTLSDNGRNEGRRSAHLVAGEAFRDPARRRSAR